VFFGALAAAWSFSVSGCSVGGSRATRGKFALIVGLVPYRRPSA
jgi:hypothetical protein